LLSGFKTFLNTVGPYFIHRCTQERGEGKYRIPQANLKTLGYKKAIKPEKAGPPCNFS
jgi:hypothetical protein